MSFKVTNKSAYLISGLAVATLMLLLGDRDWMAMSSSSHGSLTTTSDTTVGGATFTKPIFDDSSEYVVSFHDSSMALCNFEWEANNFGDNLGVPLIKNLIKKKLGHQNVTFDLPVNNFAHPVAETIAFRKKGGKCLIHLGMCLYYMSIFSPLLPMNACHAVYIHAVLVYVGSILENGHAGDYVWGTGSREMFVLRPGKAI